MYGGNFITLFCHVAPLLFRTQDQRVMIDPASNPQPPRPILYANHLHLAQELDISVALVEILPRYREDAFKMIAQINRPTHQTVESGAAEILSFALEWLCRTHAEQPQRAVQQHSSAMATVHVSPCHECRRRFITGKPTTHWYCYQISSSRLQVDSQTLKYTFVCVLL